MQRIRRHKIEHPPYSPSLWRQSGGQFLHGLVLIVLVADGIHEISEPNLDFRAQGEGVHGMLHERFFEFQRAFDLRFRIGRTPHHHQDLHTQKGNLPKRSHLDRPDFRRFERQQRSLPVPAQISVVGQFQFRSGRDTIGIFFADTRHLKGSGWHGGGRQHATRWRPGYNEPGEGFRRQLQFRGLSLKIRKADG